ncbi:hypothetical protein PMIN01_07748 [Paraphaeosphaeria minitans]|uniref:Uncharacterized protein n=1 Tax=Paraphaeosphaeria minitans TaxID=565426 RepID=A0A9P6KQ88_9PLEO|nr:hypothetical protein PMIN01_07748 [Paraphaeosphaeria minitans]
MPLPESVCGLEACLRMSMLVLRMSNHFSWRRLSRFKVRGDGCRSTTLVPRSYTRGSGSGYRHQHRSVAVCRRTGVSGSCLQVLLFFEVSRWGPKQAISGPAGWNDCRSAGSCILDLLSETRQRRILTN